MSVTVTVVIPTFNRQQLLKRALNSVLSQTQPANEIIVVDTKFLQYDKHES